MKVKKIKPLVFFMILCRGPRYRLNFNTVPRYKHAQAFAGLTAVQLTTGPTALGATAGNPARSTTREAWREMWRDARLSMEY